MRVPGLLALAVLFSLPHSAPAETGPGAVLPWTTYEAEQAATTGSVLGPDYVGHTPAREASGRACVRLAATGQFVEFAAKADAQAIVVRYCIPDAPGGGGIDATLGLYVNGTRRGKLPLTSRYTYLYGNYPFGNDPAAGTPRHFWDEVRLMPGAIHRGDVIRLRKDADDVAAEYLIDLVDLEPVPPPLPRPANALSVTDFGAVPDATADAHDAFTAAVTAAKAQHKAVWIPAGRFLVRGPILLSDVVLCGAGMWYSTLVGTADYKPADRVAIYGDGSNVTLSDFAILGNLAYRNDAEANDGLGGSFGTGSSIRNVWVEHTKTGAWLVNSDGLVVDGCRFRDTIADGINLCVGMRNTVVRNCSARGTGDDCFAMWPTTYMPPAYSPGSNRFVSCTAQLPFLAQAFSIYGGEGNAVERCEAIDVPYGAGLLASTTFPTEFGFRGMTSFTDSRLVRAGDGDGAIGTCANRLDLAGLRFENVEVVDSPRDGIRFTSIQGHALGDTEFDRIRIVNPGLAGAGCGIVAASGAVGSATLRDVSVINPKTVAVQNQSPAFHLVSGEGNSGMADTEPASGTSAAGRDISGGR